MMGRGRRWRRRWKWGFYRLRSDIIQPTRIEGVEGVVAEGAVQVHIPGGVAQRVEAGPTAEGGD
jgi:hypothetical protein